MKEKQRYIILFISTIILGLVSRKMTFIPPLTGDALYAMMTYWLFRILLTNNALKISLYYALIFCFCIEFLQLIQLPLFIWIRAHPFLRLIFGQGFLWSDLLAYIFGATAAYLLDIKVVRKY